MILLSIFLSLLSLTHQDLIIPQQRVNQENEIVDIYDFEVDGMYYAFLSDSTVQLTRKSSLFLPINSVESGNYYSAWYHNDERAYDYEGNRCYTGDIIIPDIVEYNNHSYNVVGINSDAFSYSAGLTSIVVGQQEIFAGFDHCKSLKSITFTKAVDCLSSICSSCDSLTTVVIPEGFIELYNSFSYCPSLKKIDIPNSANHFTFMGGDIGSEVIDFETRDMVHRSKVTIENTVAAGNYTIKRLVLPQCDTLHLLHTGLWYSPEMKEIRYKPTDMILYEGGEFWEWAMVYHLSCGITVSESATPPEVVFIENNGSTVRAQSILYVPDESVEAYRTAPYWEEFKEVRSMTQYDEEMAAAMIGVSSDTTDAALTCTSLGTTLSVECPIATSLDIWTMQGQRVWHGDIAPDAPASVNLPHDIYILTANGHSIKVRH